MINEVRRHDSEKFAHREAFAEYARELERVFETVNTRLLVHDRELARLERWRWRVEGGIWTLSALIGGGALGLIGHILGRW